MNLRVMLGLVLLSAGALFWGDDEPASVAAPSSAAPPVVKAMAPPPAPLAALPALIDRNRLFPAPAPAPAGSARDLFPAQSWAAPVPQAVAPIPVAAPDFPLSYVGKKREDGSWTVFLSREDMTMVLKEGDIVEQVFQVVRIAPPVLTVAYLPMNHSYNLAIGDDE